MSSKGAASTPRAHLSPNHAGQIEVEKSRWHCTHFGLFGFVLLWSLFSMVLIPSFADVDIWSTDRNGLYVGQTIPHRPGEPTNATDHLQDTLVVDEARPCFHARRSSSPVAPGEHLPLPVLNLGFPKGGSTSLQQFFECGLYDTSHYKCRKRTENGTAWDEKGVTCGKCIRHAVNNGIADPLRHCGDYQVWTQLDVELGRQTDGCYFPQIEALDLLHEIQPDATLILTFRPVNKWIDSIAHWKGFDVSMMDRLQYCGASGSIAGLKSGTRQDFASWWCGHVERVRNFVSDHPSHRLVEVDIEADDAPTYMSEQFGIDQACWGHRNKNLVKNLAANEEHRIDVHPEMPLWMKKHIRRQRKKAKEETRGGRGGSSLPDANDAPDRAKI